MGIIIEPMKWISAFRPRVASLASVTLAVLLLGSMAVREYAHVLDHLHHFHGDPTTFTTELTHNAVFHCMGEAATPFEPFCWCRRVVEILPVFRDNLPSGPPRLLPDTRAPPVFA